MAIELAELSGADSVLFVYILEWSHEIDISEGFLANLVDEKMKHTVNLDYLLVGPYHPGYEADRTQRQPGGGQRVSETLI